MKPEDVKPLLKESYKKSKTPFKKLVDKVKRNAKDGITDSLKHLDGKMK